MITDNPGADFDRWDAWKESLSKPLPRCSKCRKPIEDERYVEIDDYKICPVCLEKHFTRDNEAFS